MSLTNEVRGLMQQGLLLSNNTASVSGKIITDFTFSHEVYGEGFYNFDLEVPRLSEAHDVLPVVISERLIDRSLITPGTFVMVNGQIRSYNNVNATDRKNKLILTVFTRDIKILDTPGYVNDICLNGYICKSPVYRTTPFGREIADILLAVNRSYNKSDYIPCIAWGRNARFAGKLSIGDNIKINGRMQSRAYEKKYDDGRAELKTAYEVSVSKLEFGSQISQDEEEIDEQKYT